MRGESIAAQRPWVDFRDRLYAVSVVAPVCHYSRLVAHCPLETMYFAGDSSVYDRLPRSYRLYVLCLQAPLDMRERRRMPAESYGRE